MKQQVIITLENRDDGTVNIKTSFEPGLMGEESEGYEDMTDDEKSLQSVAVQILHGVLESVSD